MVFKWAGGRRRWYASTLDKAVESFVQDDQMSVPGELHDLVERFDRDRASYRSGTYNEAQARVDFINPLLGLLGWDVENREGRPEAYRDVVYEDRVKVGGGTKAPDYGFYAGG